MENLFIEFFEMILDSIKEDLQKKDKEKMEGVWI